MAKQFSNWDDLMRHLESQMVINLEKIGEEIKNVLRFNIKQLWYDRYTPTNYERTYEVIDSLRCSKAKKVNNNTYEVIIYFDFSQIRPYSTASGSWNKHMSLDGSTEYGGKTIGEWLVTWIETGQDSPYFSWRGVYPIETTKQWVQDDLYLLNRMKELLGKQGYRVI